MTYRVEMRPQASRALRRIHPRDQARLYAAIELLARDPRPPASRPLVGSDYFRVRVGDYRVIYSIDDGRLLILVLALGHRRQVYER
ncbi:type II toxin-antitoxin system RelE family toxin [Demequina rhizosphaerae]|uniref:type II toxin-antitoxin system RelE family toxin n=1 Tax=Demequina rhizosphaerae TaxID=1638985 RepID=UPI000783646B|nr:type II toxin-antitoxin system RelE/ParE family toxin [Demequina rhizosphaerae]